MIFWYHYNKPASKKAGKPKLTVHFHGKCHLVDAIDCRVPSFTHNRKTQPHCVVKGECDFINLHKSLDGKVTAIIMPPHVLKKVLF